MEQLSELDKALKYVREEIDIVDIKLLEELSKLEELNLNNYQDIFNEIIEKASKNEEFTYGKNKNNLVRLLSFRFILIKQVGEIKKRFNEPALQEERFKQVIKNILENAKQMSLSEIMVEKFWIMIHDKALELEYKII